MAVVDSLKCSSLRHLLSRRLLVMAIVSSSSNKASSRYSLSNVLRGSESNGLHSRIPSLPSVRTFDERSRSFNCNPPVFRLIADTIRSMESGLRFTP